MGKVLVTGANGIIGKALRRHWAGRQDLVYTDIAPHPEGEPTRIVDLADAGAVEALFADIEQVIHLGGISREGAWADLQRINVGGTYNIFEVARQRGVRRVLLASSAHAMGFYDVNTVLTPDMPPRPSNMYGVTKVFAEGLSRYYFDKFGLETLVIRIGSFSQEPLNERQLKTWISHRDLFALFEAGLAAERIGHAVLFGVSDNPQAWWVNAPVPGLDWTPQDSSRDYVGAVSHIVLDRDKIEGQFQGGLFAAEGHFDDGV